ncbi:subclass B1 metallo-beta-lactamase [Chitinophaga japonensis]|uniref:beta-lactamase n=1 Tax=Chitinophaga japonensis TaxID=104662 RepID=A0A562TGI1_CHIJA|nr:subclass B1 metallo-beta-lactamase [Chitinophaga japonensis]TWI92156.1 metallo-beta-lactamase class B [Chitinophaga japonensis]
MIKQGFIIPAIIAIQVLGACGSQAGRQPTGESKDTTAVESITGNDTIYKSDDLLVRRISPHTYQHISFLNTNSFGRVACNGMIVVNDGEAVVFDTPGDDTSSAELIGYITRELQARVNAVVATHFHADCLGGLEAFHRQGIPSYANDRTIELAKEKKSAVPQKGFSDHLVLHAGGREVYADYLGEGHTKDNIVGYFPGDSILFGGCLIKETGGGKGNLEDANTGAWSATVSKVKAKYPQAKVVIPGHGSTGGTALLDYTIELFDPGQ